MQNFDEFLKPQKYIITMPLNPPQIRFNAKKYISIQ